MWEKSVDDLTLVLVGLIPVASVCTDIGVRAGMGTCGVPGVRVRVGVTRGGGAGFFAGGGSDVGVSGRFRFSRLCVSVIGTLLSPTTERGEVSAEVFVAVTPTGLEAGIIVVATTRRGVGLGAFSLVLETTGGGGGGGATADVSMSWTGVAAPGT